MVAADVEIGTRGVGCVPFLHAEAIAEDDEGLGASGGGFVAEGPAGAVVVARGWEGKTQSKNIRRRSMSYAGTSVR